MFLRKNPADPPSSLSKINEQEEKPKNNNPLGNLKQRILNQWNGSMSDIEQENSFNADITGDMNDSSSSVLSVKSPTTSKITKSIDLPQRWDEDQQLNLQTASSTRLLDNDISKSRPKKTLTANKITKPTNLPQRWDEDQQLNLQTASSTKFMDNDAGKNRPKNCWR